VVLDGKTRKSALGELFIELMPELYPTAMQGGEPARKPRRDGLIPLLVICGEGDQLRGPPTAVAAGDFSPQDPDLVSKLPLRLMAQSVVVEDPPGRLRRR
jgi:hypothetical protein